MDTRIIKGIIVAVVLAWSIYSFTQGNIGFGIMLLLLAGLAGFLVTRSIRLIIAFISLRRGKMESCLTWINRVNPDRLFSKSRGYFYYLQGLTLVQGGGQGSLTKGEVMFRKSLSNGLRLDLDKATAKLQLAVIAISKRKKREATNLLSEVKKLDKRGMMTAQIRQVKDGLRRI
tara:strand:- start:5342 stop:5863 length:522 start_codon:yes stop_codon:yes gene_type:complete